MSEHPIVVVVPPPSPLEQLMDYIFNNYCELDDYDSCDAGLGNPDVKQCSQCHRDSYRSGGTPKYDCSNFRKVYLIRYFATQVVQLDVPLLQCIDLLSSIQGEFRSASFGGGPGVEAIALMNRLTSCDDNHEVIFENFDIVSSWETSYYKLVKQFEGYLENVSIHPVFRRLDFPSDISERQEDKLYHITFVSWILSELDDRYERVMLLKQALDSTCENGHIILTDRTELTLICEINQILEIVDGFNLVDSNINHKGNCHIQFPSKIGDSFGPKYDYKTAYWVLLKV